MNIICYIAKSCYEFYTTFFGKIVLYFYIFLISLTTALEDGNGLNKFITLFICFVILCLCEWMNYLKVNHETKS